MGFYNRSQKKIIVEIQKQVIKVNTHTQYSLLGDVQERREGHRALYKVNNIYSFPKENGHKLSQCLKPSTNLIFALNSPSRIPI